MNVRRPFCSFFHSFMKNVYTVFSFARNAVGFAALK